MPVETLLAYRGHDVDYDDLMDVPIKRFQTTDQLTFDMASSARYIVEDPRYSLPLDVLFVPRQKSDRLLVGFHGAEDRKSVTLPKFQFVRSFMTRGESLLFISDSTLLQHENLKISWHVGNSQTPLASALSEVVTRAALDADVDETLLIGHSAGGFSAVLVGSQVPNSRAISINGQSVIANHHPWSIKALHDNIFTDCDTLNDMFDRYASRLDLRIALKTRIESSSFTIFGNKGDRSLFGRYAHFTNLANEFGLDAEGGITQHGDAFIPADWGSIGGSAHPLPGSIMPFVRLVLGEKEPTVAFEYSVDPTWHK